MKMAKMLTLKVYPFTLKLKYMHNVICIISRSVDVCYKLAHFIIFYLTVISIDTIDKLLYVYVAFSVCKRH